MKTDARSISAAKQPVADLHIRFTFDINSVLRDGSVKGEFPPSGLAAHLQIRNREAAHHLTLRGVIPKLGAAPPAPSALPRMLLNLLLFSCGLVLLYYGAEWLVDAASALARRLGVSPFVVGLTLVAFGTSAPEYLVSLLSVFAGSPGLAIGNVVGSNIANIGLILGVSAMLMVIPVDRHARRRDLPFMLVAFGLFALVAFAGTIHRLHALVLVAMLVAFLWRCAQQARSERAQARETGALALAQVQTQSFAALVPRLILGAIALVGGAHLMVESAIFFARAMGVSELVIGVSIVAVGTSLPELAACVSAAFRKEAGLSLGNILGSNIFNVGFVIGGVALVRPLDVPDAALRFDLPAMLLFGGILALLMLRPSLRRPAGVLLLLLFVAYLALTYHFSA